MIINDEQIIEIDALTEEPYFHSHGCENCNNHLGNDVQDYACVTTTEKFGDDKVEDWYTIRLCTICANAYYNAEPLDKECQNIYEI